MLIVIGSVLVYFNIGYLSAWHTLWLAKRSCLSGDYCGYMKFSWRTFLVFPITTNNKCGLWNDWRYGDRSYVTDEDPESIKLVVRHGYHMDRGTYYVLEASFWPFFWAYRLVISLGLILWHLVIFLATYFWCVVTIPVRQALKCSKKT
jgi:hypothetical protein